MYKVIDNRKLSEILETTKWTQMTGDFIEPLDSTACAMGVIVTTRYDYDMVTDLKN